MDKKNKKENRIIVLSDPVILILSFILILGVTFIFWGLDINNTFIKKPRFHKVSKDICLSAKITNINNYVYMVCEKVGEESYRLVFKDGKIISYKENWIKK